MIALLARDSFIIRQWVPNEERVVNDLAIGALLTFDEDRSLKTLGVTRCAWDEIHSVY